MGQKRRRVSQEDFRIASYLIRKAHKSEAKRLFPAEEAAWTHRFGNSDLHQPFLWKKKLKHDLLLIQQQIHHDDPTALFDAVAAAVKKRNREAADEMEKLRKRRERIRIERAEKDEKRRRCDQQNWPDGDEAFCYQQCLARSRIRLRDRRPEAIDVLSIYFVDAAECCGRSFDEPHKVFDEMPLRELEQLRQDISFRTQLVSAAAQHMDYWNALLVVCDWKLAELGCCRYNRGLKSEVRPEVELLLESKSYQELEELESDIEAKLTFVKLHKAISYLKSFHSNSEFNNKKIEFEEDNEIEMEAGSKDSMEETNLAISTSSTLGFSEEKSDDDHSNLVKPKYLSRVLIGYDWNKYNRVHYDHENPPPKMVRGYKLQVFYPDLPAKATPVCSVEKDGRSSETCLLRIHADWPYHDLVFRIVQRDWEYSTKKGFKSTFDRGVLQLHFNFKRCVYRR